MEEPKKISFSTIGPAKTSKKKVKRRKAIRIAIKLPESNEKSCPEYSYGELLSQYMAKQKKQQQLVSPGRRPPPSTPGLDSDEDDDALQAMARNLEKKYGNSYNTSGKRKKRRKDSDFNALGEGYDENDSFIDNTGAYDEVLPSNMETKHGGFYINSGELDYRELSDSEEGNDNSNLTSTPVQTAKRKLRVESDEDEEATPTKTQQEADTVTNGTTSGGGSAMDEGELLRKRRKLISKLNAKKSAQQPDSQPTPTDSISTSATTTTPTTTVAITATNTTTSSTTTTANMSNVAASIESVVNKVRNEVSKTSAAENHIPTAPAPTSTASSEPASPPTPPTSGAAVAEAGPDEASPPSGAATAPAATETSGGSDDASNSSSSSSSSSSDDSSTSSDNSSSSDSEEEEEDAEAKANGGLDATPATPLPATPESGVAITSTVAAVVEAVATADTASNSMDTPPAAASTGLMVTTSSAASREGKTLPDNLSPDLLAVIELLKEEGRKAIGCSSSQKFFTDKVKGLVLSIETKLQESGGRKKTQVYQYLSHHVPCGPATLVKRAKQMLQHVNENKVALPLRNLKEVLDREMPVLMESFAEECRLAAQQQSTDAPASLSSADDKKKQKMPKKRYNFTPESDACLQIVVAARVSLWLEGVGKKAGDTPEDFITSFLETEVRVLWPKGWVTTRQLYRQCAPTHASITSPLGEPPSKAVFKKAAAVTSLPSVATVPTSIPFPKPSSSVPSKAAVVTSATKPASVLPVDVVAAAKMTDSVGKLSYEDELALKQQKVPQPTHRSSEVTNPLPRLDEGAPAVKVAEQSKKPAVDVRRQESQAKPVVMESEPQAVEIIPHHKIQQLEKITDQLPPSLRTELTISYKGANGDSSSQSLEITPTKVIEGTNKPNDHRDISRSSADTVAVSREPVHSQNGSELTTSAEKDTLKKPSPISVKSVSSINKMSDVDFTAKAQPSQAKTSLKFSDAAMSVEVVQSKQSTQSSEKQSSHSKTLTKSVDSADSRSSKHQSQAALPSAKDAQIIDLSSDDERPVLPRSAPATAAPVARPAQFSPPPSTALTVTPVGRDSSPAFRESVSPESFPSIRDFTPTVKKPVPTAAELAPSLKKPVPTVGEFAPSIRKPVPAGGALSTPIKKPIPTVGELALSSKSPCSPGFSDTSNSKLEEEMDDVMNELLQISKKKQQSSPPVSSGSDSVKTSSVPNSQHKEKQHRTSSSSHTEHSTKSSGGVTVTETFQHKEKTQRSAQPSATDPHSHKKKVSPLARLQQEQQQQLLMQQKLMQQEDILETYQKLQMDKSKAEEKQSQQKKQKTSHNSSSSLPSGMDSTYYHSSASGLTITSKSVKQPQVSPNSLLQSASSVQPSPTHHSSGSNHTPSKSIHHPSSNSHYPLSSPYQLSPPSQFSPSNSHGSSSSQRGSNSSYPNSSQHSSTNHGKSSSTSSSKVSQPTKSPRSSGTSSHVNSSYNNSNHSSSSSSSQRGSSSHHQSSSSQGFSSVSQSTASTYNSGKSSSHNNGGSASLHSGQGHYGSSQHHSSSSGKVPSPQYSPGSAHRSPSASKHPFSIATLSTSSVKSTSPSDAGSRNISHINSLHTGVHNNSVHGGAHTNLSHSKPHSNSAHGGGHSNSVHNSSTHSSASSHRGVSMSSALHNSALPLAHSFGAKAKVPTSNSKDSRDSGGSYKHRKSAVHPSPEKESQFGMLSVEQQRELLLKQHQVQQMQQDMWLKQHKQSGASHNNNSNSSNNKHHW